MWRISASFLRSAGTKRQILSTRTYGTATENGRNGPKAVVSSLPTRGIIGRCGAHSESIKRPIRRFLGSSQVSKLPLSPMLVQYLVGLCCLKWNPDAIDVTIGDMVLDPAASKQRDVDITVTISASGGVTHAFKAYEVKHESSPLDVTDVEQLCLKLLDMPSVTHRAIVSGSGFTSSAQSKAARHGVTLYGLRPWTRPLQEQFPALRVCPGSFPFLAKLS
jgi:hypothetical protein